MHHFMALKMLEKSEKTKSWPVLPSDPRERDAFLKNRKKVTEAVHSVDLVAITESAKIHRAGHKDRDRRQFMLIHGFTEEKGDHHKYQHPLLEAYAKFHDLKIPGNLWNIKTSEQKVGYESVDIDGKGRSFNGSVKRVEWMVNAITQKIKAGHSLELRKMIRENICSMTQDRRTLSQERRKLCKAFREGGVRAAVEMVQGMRPDLDKVEERIETAKRTISILRQRAGDNRVNNCVNKSATSPRRVTNYENSVRI